MPISFVLGHDAEDADESDKQKDHSTDQHSATDDKSEESVAQKQEKVGSVTNKEVAVEADAQVTAKADEAAEPEPKAEEQDIKIAENAAVAETSAGSTAAEWNGSVVTQRWQPITFKQNASKALVIFSVAGVSELDFEVKAVENSSFLGDTKNGKGGQEVVLKFLAPSGGGGTKNSWQCYRFFPWARVNTELSKCKALPSNGNVLVVLEKAKAGKRWDNYRSDVHSAPRDLQSKVDCEDNLVEHNEPRVDRVHEADANREDDDEPDAE